MPVLRNWNLTVDADMVLRGQGADPAIIRAKRPALVAVAEEAMAEGVPLLEPVVGYRALAVEALQHQRLLLAGGGWLAGPLIAAHLAAAERVVVMVCTVGAALEDHASRVSAKDLLRGLALEGAGSAAAEALATEACKHFESLAAAEGLRSAMPLNPGMVGWPVEEGQAQVFALVDGSEAGVTLTESSMMIPRKSVSLVLGFGRDLAARGNPCDYCNLRESCRHRA